MGPCVNSSGISAYLRDSQVCKNRTKPVGKSEALVTGMARAANTNADALGPRKLSSDVQYWRGLPQVQQRRRVIRVSESYNPDALSDQLLLESPDLVMIGQLVP